MSNAFPKGWSIREAESLYDRLKVQVVYDKDTVRNFGKYEVIDQSQSESIGYVDDGVFNCNSKSPIVTFANHTCAVRKMITPFGVIQNVFPLKAKNDIDPHFLFQLLREAVPQNGYKGHYPELREKRFAVPTKAEQQKIAEILTSVDEVIENTQSQINKLEDLKKATMNELFTKGIGHTEFKDTEIGKVPQQWNVETLAKLMLTIKPGPFGSSITKSMYVEEGFKVYGQEQVIRGDCKFGDYFISRKKYEELSAFKIESGDLLMSLVGTVGKTLLIPKNFVEGIINPRLILLRPGQRVLATYLQHYFSSNLFQEELRKIQQGGTMGVLSAGILKPLSIPVPHQDEQTRIVGVIDTVITAISKLGQKRTALLHLKNSLMQDLLTGKVRVTVN